ncbi:MAG: hydantoinase/oxoprolinase family protein [Pseudomonadota bacterium]
MSVRYRLGIDVGGTFTDFVLARAAGGSAIAFHKEPSVPADPSQAVEVGVAALIAREGIAPGEIELVVHGTTLALNAIIQGRGARVALVVSRGNRDVMEIARARMPNSYDFTAGREAPLIPREAVFEVGARGLSDGRVLCRADSEEIAAVAGEIAAGGYEAVAVMLLNSYRDSTLEADVAARLSEALPDLPVTPSAAIWPEMREYERALVTCMNSYVHPLMDGYFERLQARISDLGVTAPIYITANNGGSVSLATARARPVDTVLSGPASGVLAATRTAPAENALITFDMGGTSTDISISRERALEFTHSTLIGDYPLMLPVVNVSAIGAGGGSIVWADAQGLLKVGPESAGADPGPVCYGRGGMRPTITDCYLTLGYLDPARFNDGRLALDAPAAATALAKTGAAAGQADAVATAAAALRVATARMATELRKLMAEKGLDPRGFVLAAFGGAGPTHANMLAEEARLEGVLVPRLPGTFCALGAILADVRRDYVRQARITVDRSGADWAGIDALLAEMEGEALDWVAGEGALIGTHALRLTCDMRYPGQAFELPIGVADYDRKTLTPATLIDLFNAEHDRLYGFTEADSAVQITTLRLSVVGQMAAIPLPEAPPGPLPEPRAIRRVHSQDWRDVPVYDRADIGSGATLDGPAIVEQPDTTVLILAGWQAVADSLGNLMIRRMGERA